MYIVLVFIGVVSLRYNNAAEWFQMAKTRHKISSLVIFHKFSFKQVFADFKISVSGAFVHFNIQNFVKLLQA